MKTLFTVIVLAMLAVGTSAQTPISAIKHRVADKKFWLATGISIGTSIAATITISRCRHDHGIGPCTNGGYGPFQARETLRQVQTGFLILPSYKIKAIEDRNNDKHKFWWLFPAINAGLDSGMIIQNARKHYGPKAD